VCPTQAPVPSGVVRQHGDVYPNMLAPNIHAVRIEDNGSGTNGRLSDFEDVRAKIIAAKAVDFTAADVQMQLLDQLLAGEPNSVTNNEILTNLYLGRIGDTECENHSLLIAAVNFTREAHDSWKNEAKKNPKMIFRMPIIMDGRDVSGDSEPNKEDVGPESFIFNESHSLKQAICRIHKIRQEGKKVLVACAQGKDRSALVVLAYLMVEYQVLDRQKVYDFVQNKRYIVSTKEIPRYWEFLEEFAKNWNPTNLDQECRVVLGSISRSSAD